MENAINISSEEELAQLRNEGKISEAEYQELLSAMKKPSPFISKDAISEENKAKSKRVFGKIAYALMLMGILLPILFCIVASLAFHVTNATLGILLIPGLILETAALITGIKSWPNDSGKTAIIVSGIIVSLFVFCISYNYRPF